MKLYISPTFTHPDKADGGIRRVIEAMIAHLPTHGIEIVKTPEEAEIINIHAAAYVDHINKPMVASCHGLYWTNYKWDHYYHVANRAVIETMVRAQAVTAPSKWVARAIGRGILHNPLTIYHGIDTDFWEPTKTAVNPAPYVLWNKARADIISNPNDLIQISSLMTDTHFKTTIGNAADNVDVLGVVPYPEMVSTIKGAFVYLATARETFGIGTLEAMAAGVPVAGWKFGGQEEIIKEGITGKLAPYGDYKALEGCIRYCMENRQEMGKNARLDALERWQWPDKIAQYAEVFWNTYNEWYKPRPKYSVIIPAYNLARFLPAALDSVEKQTADNIECIIIDDCSTDNTQEVVKSFSEASKRPFTYHKTPQNSGLCNVRNWGAGKANGRYILYLDADDQLHPEALETLGEYLDSHPESHIAYGRIDFTDEHGQQYRKGDNPAPYDWFKQMAHFHQFPIGASLMRRDIIQRSGGFRIRNWRAEDAAWISRVTSLGIRAHKATDSPVLLYRVRNDSKSAIEAKESPQDVDGNWLSWLGWHIAGNRADGGRAIQTKQKPPWYLVPFGAQPIPTGYDPPYWNMDHHQDPLISVIIPVGPGHDKYLIDALDSLLAQTVPYWEAVVVNDTGEEIDTSYAPWARVIDSGGGKGAAAARNIGARAARAPLLYFLDSDDWLLSGGIDAMVREWLKEDGEKYIYTNYVDINANGRIKHQKMKPYNQKEWRAQHAVNILINKDDFWKVGGFEESMKGWEDWDLPLKLAIAGLCGHHLPVESFVYRLYSGKLREWAVSQQSELLTELRGRYAPYYGGGRAMAKCCGGSNAAKSILMAKARYGDMTAKAALVSMSVHAQHVDSVRMKFTGQERGSITFQRIGGQMLTKSYKGASTPALMYINAHPSDVKLLISSGKWQVVKRPQRSTANLPAARPPAVNVEPIQKPPEPIRTEQNKKVYTDPVLVNVTEGGETAVSITRAAQKLADKKGIDTRLLIGTGKNGKITVSDIRGAL